MAGQDRSPVRRDRHHRPGQQTETRPPAGRVGRARGRPCSAFVDRATWGPVPRPPACLLAVALLAPPAVAKASGYETTVTGAAKEEELPEERATSEVTRADLDRRVARSLPEALRYEPGVFVQQLAHSQAAAYLRGLTGQQTVLLFDGVRLNNSTWRQGPNQYLFTVDPRTVGSIDVLRGGGSTRHGSDALGGVVLAHPIEPLLVALGQSASARVFARAATSDSEIGGRAEASASLARRGFTLGLLAGVGARGVGLQESAGSVKNPDPDTPIGPYPETPAFASDGRTQLGTGFKELTADGRLVLRLSPTSAFTAAAYLYRQYDAPRTDQCPPPAASFNTCLTYEEQFRHLIYAAWEGRAGRVATNARITLSFQRQHERQRLDYPLLYTRHLGLDDVDTLGLAAHAVTATWRPRPSVAIALLYGVDTYLDLVRSSATLSFTDIPLSSKLPRGAYLDGSSYLYGGAFLDGEVGFSRRLFLRAGARLSWFAAEAPADPESQSRAISRSFVPLVGHAGIEWRAPLAALSSLHLLANVDHSFRAPNLDDLTARLQSGPGFQFESPDLAPERST
ncbi:MAG: TonB-dependent receptor, partial [Myxococcales bacterium]|nr:TonB-dependent receptor [Myxococcales bacterium]